MDTSKVTIGSTVKKHFVIALFGGFLLFGILLTTLGFSGTVFAVPLGGMGDFYVTFDKLEGKGFILNPQVGETGNADAVPMVRNEIDTATIDNLHIYKDLKMPTGKWIRVNVKASQPTVVAGLIQDARFIDANLAFDELGIKQTNTSQMSVEEAFQKNWRQEGETVTITDAKIVTDYLFQNSVTLNGALISIDKIEAPEKTATENESDNNVGRTAIESDQDDSGGWKGGFLPKTASNWLLPIFIGACLLFAGTMLAVRRRRNTVIGERY